MSRSSVVRFRLSSVQKDVLAYMATGYILHHDPRPPCKSWMYNPEKRCYRDLYYRTFQVLIENQLIRDPGTFFPIARFELTSKGRAIAIKKAAKR